jgi:hypothetical protein
MTEQEFDLFLGRVADFHQTVAENVAELDPHPEPRYGLAFQSALLSIEHGSAAYVLIASRFHAPAYSLLRTQFETLVRGIWLMYAASDSWVEKLNQPLTVESAESTKDALMLDKMLKALRASESAPIKSIQDIMRKDVGVDGDAQRIGQLVWMLFLKIFDDREEELELPATTTAARIPEPCAGATGRPTPKA